MKIYPGTHSIISTNKIDKDNDVQIAYVTNEHSEVTLGISTQYTQESEEALVPYETFDHSDLVLFDSNGNKIDDTYNYIVRTDSGAYQYVPKNIVSTIKPTEFSYRIIGKRNEKLNKLKNYHLSIKCLNDKFDTDDSTSLLDTIRSIFLYAADRKLCPNYIIVNENDQNKFMYDQNESSGVDFCFMKSDDGLSINDTQILNLPSSLDYTNLWVIVKDSAFPNTNHTVTLYDYNGTDRDFSLNTILYDSIDYKSAAPKLFLASNYKENVDNDIFTLSETMYSPVLIKEDKVHKRYIIYSTESMFNTLTTHDTHIIFEYIMQLYLMSYFASEYYTSWISDEMPDYVVNNHKMIKQLNFVSPSSYYDLIGTDKESITLDSIEINNTNISYSINASDYIVFNKTQKDEQFTKPTDCISIYCHNKTIIYYKDNVFLRSNNLLECVTYSYNVNTLTVTINNYIDSFNNVYIPQAVLTKTIPSSKIGNILIVMQNGFPTLLYESEYSDELLLATITMQTDSTEDRMLYDIRLRGGGLPKYKQHDHQSILDIGSIYGVSYRRGGSIIVRIPVELKKYHDRIKHAIDKHIAADAHAFIIYY